MDFQKTNYEMGCSDIFENLIGIWSKINLGNTVIQCARTDILGYIVVTRDGLHTF